jgi:hypothetical protein
MPNPINVPITPPRVAFIDERNGNVSREWYLFFLSLYQTQGGSSVSLDDVQKGPTSLTVDEINHAIKRATANVAPDQDGLLAQIAELQKQVEALAVLPAQITAMLSQLADVSAMNPSDGDKLIYNGTTGKWEQDSRSYLMLE